MTTICVLALSIASLAPTTQSHAEEHAETLLLQQPAMNKTHVVFVYARNLWIVPRAGGTARALTSHVGTETRPRISPDGSTLAFSAEYGGNYDVYTMPITGGTPTRHTWHPGMDLVEGWHPNGKQVLFTSRRRSGTPVSKAYLTVEAAGKAATQRFVEPLPLPRVGRAAFDTTGKRIAYAPIRDAFRTWKRYRGGQTSPMWIYDTETHEVEVVPHENASDTMPCWIGDELYFASDRADQMNAYRYNAEAKSVEALTEFTRDGFGVRTMTAGPDGLVFTRGGAIHILDPKTKAVTRLRIHVPTDGLARLPRWEKASKSIHNGDVSPNGKRAVLEVRGEIVTVPREHGGPRYLSRSEGANDRFPTWSPDGKRIAWFSDRSGEYQLLVRDRLGEKPPKAYAINDTAGYYADPQWSPDGKHIAFSDKSNRVLALKLADGSLKTISHSQGSLGYWRPYATWSPDSKWLAVEEKNPTTAYGGIKLYELATGDSKTITDAFGDSHSPAFTRDGKHLYFCSSAQTGPNQFGLDMSAHRMKYAKSNMYLVVLKKDGKNPLAPKIDEGIDKDDKKGKKKKKAKDEEKQDGEGEQDAADKEDKEEKKEKRDDEEKEDTSDASKKKKEDKPSVDLEGIEDRILAVPGSRGNYFGLGATKSKMLYLEWGEGRKRSLRAYDPKTKKHKNLVSGCTRYAISKKGTTVLFKKGDAWSLMDENGKSEKKLPTSSVSVRVDPAKEWRQILREVWRIQRDFFYDPNLHHVNWDAMWERWSAFLPYVQHREDLNVILQEMMGELCCGHEYVGGGEMDEAEEGPPVGLLGADIVRADDAYVIKKIYRGQNWNPGLRSPLTEPGIDVRVGDIVRSVNGRLASDSVNIYALMEGTAGVPTRITFSRPDSTEKERTFTIVPIASENRLRRRAWVEANRKRVDKLSGGRLAYIYMPDTGRRGLAAFDRDYYSQLDKEGVVIDERFNGGGKIADYVVNVLARKVLCYWMNREGWVGRTPFGTIEGPKVMIINDRAGSGGDAMPWLFRKQGVGKLVGTRTWGGLVGISGYPDLMDGGFVTAASFGIMDTDGKWIIENEGVTPDVEVQQWPRDVIKGGDPQLEKAVKLALEALEKSPRRKPPVYVKPAAR